MNSNTVLSDAGVWIPVTNNSVLSSKYHGALANTFHSIIALDNSGNYGMVVTGWGYSGWPPSLTAAPPVSIGILTPGADGNLKINTAQYISNPVTNGGGSMIVADFNADGKQDIVSLAHNESPFSALPSVAWLSNANGGFTRVELNDLVMAHDAELVSINGKPAIATGSFTTDDKGNTVVGALSNPIYTFSNGAFAVTVPLNISKLGGMDTTITNSGTTSGQQVVRGDVATYTSDWTRQLTSNINVYAFNGTDATAITPIQSIIPYLSTLPQYQNFPAQIGGTGLTHTYRLWADDLNNDGKQDILAGESMWSQSTPNFPSALQVLINKGDGTFRDATATLNADMGFNTSEMDYNPNFIDLDHTGIKTYLFAGSTSWGSMARQSDYVLLNDGTGRLYIGLHNEFTTLAHQVFSYLGMGYNDSSTPPRFIGIPQSDGSLSFVAEVATSAYNNIAQLSQTAYQYVNVPLHYNPKNDFTQNVTVADRNQSMLVRTWAGNDTFYDTNANALPAHIDGGLGTDVSHYSLARNQYQVTHNNDGTWSVAKSGGVTDTLKGIERLQFSDMKLALDLSATQHAAQALELIGVVAPESISNPAIVGLIMGVIDQGVSMRDTFQILIDDGIVNSRAGASTDSAIAAMAFRNVIGTEADRTTLDMLVGYMDGRYASLSHADFLTAIAGMEVNQTHIDLIGLQQTGLIYS